MLIAVITSDLLGREGVAPNGTSGRRAVAGCSSSLSVAVTNTDQKQLGEKSICLSCASRSWIIIEGGPGKNSSRNRSRKHREALAGSYSGSFLIQPRTMLPKVDWALPHQSSVKTTFHRHGHRPI